MASLRRDPGDLDLWGAISRIVERNPDLRIDFLKNCPRSKFWRAWKTGFLNKSAISAFLLLRGWELPKNDSSKLPLWWEEQGRAGRADNYFFDKVTGNPLFVIHRMTGARLVWVPPCKVRGPDWLPCLKLRRGRWVSATAETWNWRKGSPFSSRFTSGRSMPYRQSLTQVQRLNRESLERLERDESSPSYRMVHEREWLAFCSDTFGYSSSQFWGIEGSHSKSEWCLDPWREHRKVLEPNSDPSLGENANLGARFYFSKHRGDWPDCRVPEFNRGKEESIGLRYVFCHGPRPKKAES